MIENSKLEQERLLRSEKSVVFDLQKAIAVRKKFIKEREQHDEILEKRISFGEKFLEIEHELEWKMSKMFMRKFLYEKGALMK